MRLWDDKFLLSSTHFNWIVWHSCNNHFAIYQFCAFVAFGCIEYKHAIRFFRLSVEFFPYLFAEALFYNCVTNLSNYTANAAIAVLICLEWSWDGWECLRHIASVAAAIFKCNFSVPRPLPESPSPHYYMFNFDEMETTCSCVPFTIHIDAEKRRRWNAQEQSALWNARHDFYTSY